jgi:hypothetical protein
MAVTAKYEKPLQVVETAEMRARIIAIADAEGISQAQVCRDLNALAIDERERISATRTAG